MSAQNRTRRTPKKARERTDKQHEFLEALRAAGNVTDACRATDLPRRTVYEWRDADAEFAAAWSDALDEAADTMEREAFRRAVEGVDKPVYGSLGRGAGTGEVGRIREYSDTLLIFLLKAARPDKYRERSAVQLDMTPAKAAELSDADLDAELRRRGLL